MRKTSRWRCAALVAALLAAPLATQGGAAWAIPCDELRAEIEAKFRAGGVNGVVIAVADAASAVPGRVVGSCERGTKKLLRVADAARRAASAAGPARPVRPALVTECADGRVITEGECRQ